MWRITSGWNPRRTSTGVKYPLRANHAWYSVPSSDLTRLGVVLASAAILPSHDLGYDLLHLNSRAAGGFLRA
jgi:hypothetical protein